MSNFSPGLSYSYSSGPAAAVAVDYATVSLTWTAPTGGLYLYLVRNRANLPTDHTDGTQLAMWGAPFPDSYVDVGLDVAGFGGSFLYYTLFMQDAKGYWRSADMPALLPAAYGYGARLFSLLPQHFQDLDNAQVPGYQS